MSNSKTQFDFSNKSKNKKNKIQSKKTINCKELKLKDVKEFAAQGKENWPPKTNSQNDYIENKRSSVPRIDKSRLLSKKASTISKKSLNKKQTINKSAFKSNQNIYDVPTNYSLLGYSNSRGKLSAKRLINKQYQSGTDEESKVFKQLEALYHLIINWKFISELDKKNLSGKHYILNEIESKTVHKASNNELEPTKESEEEILTSRFEKSSANKNLLPTEESSLNKHFVSWKDEKTYNKGVLMKVKK